MGTQLQPQVGLAVAQDIKLHGGPMHGETVTIPGLQDCLHIVTTRGPVPEWTPGTPFPENKLVETEEGTYTRVRSTTDFEWIGWVGHDD